MSNNSYLLEIFNNYGFLQSQHRNNKKWNLHVLFSCRVRTDDNTFRSALNYLKNQIVKAGLKFYSYYHVWNFARHYQLTVPPGKQKFFPSLCAVINSRLHVDDTDFALPALLAGKFWSDTWNTQGHASAEVFQEFARRVGVRPRRIDKLKAPFLVKQELVEILISGHLWLNLQN